MIKKDRTKEFSTNQIYILRGKQVILDRDLAKLYTVATTRLREQVKRNKERFPQDFMFQLNDSEVEFMVSQNAIPSRKALGGHLPYVFTQEGIAMLSSVLRSPRAISVNILIMRIFAKFRQNIFQNSSIISRNISYRSIIERYW